MYLILEAWRRKEQADLPAFRGGRALDCLSGGCFLALLIAQGVAHAGAHDGRLPAGEPGPERRGAERDEYPFPQYEADNPETLLVLLRFRRDVAPRRLRGTRRRLLRLHLRAHLRERLSGAMRVLDIFKLDSRDSCLASSRCSASQPERQPAWSTATRRGSSSRSPAPSSRPPSSRRRSRLDGRGERAAAAGAGPPAEPPRPRGLRRARLRDEGARATCWTRKALGPATYSNLPGRRRCRARRPPRRERAALAAGCGGAVLHGAGAEGRHVRVDLTRAAQRQPDPLSFLRAEKRSRSARHHAAHPGNHKMNAPCFLPRRRRRTRRVRAHPSRPRARRRAAGRRRPGGVPEVGGVHGRRRGHLLLAHDRAAAAVLLGEERRLVVCRYRPVPLFRRTSGLSSTWPACPSTPRSSRRLRRRARSRRSP